MPARTCLHGVALIEKVIARVQQHGFAVLGTCGPPRVPQPVPIPEPVLQTLTFPNGQPLSPALRRWLAFDSAWLGFFADPNAPVFQPLTLSQYVLQEFQLDWGYTEIQQRLLPGQVYGLHFGADSRRFLYVGAPDSVGEYPVLVLDTDDVPYTAIMYPGIDVYLAHNAGVVRYQLDTYESFATHPCYAARIQEHARRYFGGRVGFEIFELAEIAPA